MLRVYARARVRVCCASSLNSELFLIFFFNPISPSQPHILHAVPLPLPLPRPRPRPLPRATRGLFENQMALAVV